MKYIPYHHCDRIYLHRGIRYTSAPALHRLARRATDPRLRAILRELKASDTGGTHGEFSFLDLYAGAGSLGLALAQHFKSATVVSIESNSEASSAHLHAQQRLNVSNNLLCESAIDAEMLKDLYESPELFRYASLGGNLLDHLAAAPSRDEFGKSLGAFVSVAMTSFIELPSATALSLALATLYPPPIVPLVDEVRQGSGLGTGINDEDDPQLGTELAPSWEAPSSTAAARYGLGMHPTAPLERAEAVIVSGLVRSPDGAPSNAATRISVRTLAVSPPPPLVPAASHGNGVPKGVAALESLTGSGLVRVDILNMTRQVNHHFQFHKDGHTRKYTMHVVVNDTALSELEKAADAGVKLSRYEAARRLLPVGNHPNRGGVVSVYLQRKKDDFHIPYDSVSSITLIALLRLGLVESLREEAWGRFMRLPLYEDMAPWNIVFRGSRMDYIDYDTKQKTFDMEVAQVYRILSVLFNYKRTVQDFGKCSHTKARTEYGFSHVSECVGDTSYQAFNGPCPESNKPVPCGDGQCHSDYIACLRAVTSLKANLGPKRWRGERNKQLVTEQLKQRDVPEISFGDRGVFSDSEARELQALGVDIKYRVPSDGAHARRC